MLIRIRHLHNYEIKWLTKNQLVEEFRQHAELERVDVLKVSRSITRKKMLG